MKTVYLAGPISHVSYGACTGWRDEAEAALKAWGIKGLSPMRGKDFLKHVTCFSQQCDAYSDNPLSSPRGIMTRDYYDATNCDVLLVNLLGAEKVSIGTVMEIAWAYQARTPIVLMIESGGTNVHEHSMIHEAIGYRTDKLAEAIEITRLILGADQMTNPIGAQNLTNVTVTGSDLNKEILWFDPRKSEALS